MGASEYLKNRAQQQRDSAQGKGTVSDFLKNKASEQRKRQEEEKKASSKAGAFSDNGGAVVRQFLDSLEAPEAPKAAHTSSFTWNVPTDAQTRHQRAQAVSMGQFQQDQTLLRKYGGSYENYLNDNRRSFDSAAEYEETVARAQQYNSQLDLKNAQSKVAEAQKTGEEMATEAQRLERSAANLQGLLARYQQTGSVVDGQSYLLAVETHNQAVAAYNEKYKAYEKQWTDAQKGYESARQKAVKDETAYVRAYDRLRKEQEAEATRTANHPQNKSYKELQQMIEDVDKQIEDLVVSGNLEAGEPQWDYFMPKNPNQAKIDQLTQQKAELSSYLYRAQTREWETKQEQAILAFGGTELMQALRDYAIEKVQDQQMAALENAGTPVRINQDLMEAEQKLWDMGVTGENFANWTAYAERMFNAEGRQAAEQLTENLANRGFGGAVAASALSVPMNMTGILGVADILGQTLIKELSGSEIPVDYNTWTTYAGKAASSATETVAEKIAKKTAGKAGSDTIFGNLYSNSYQLAMSMVNSLASGGATILLGGSAAISGIEEALERGANQWQALGVGLLYGAAEMIFEKVSLDRLFDTQSPKGWKDAILNILKQGGVEASEEMFTTIANTLGDAIIMGDKSQLRTQVRTLMGQGMSKAEAEKAALLSWGVGLVGDAIGGAVSGGLFGAGGNLVTADYTTKRLRKNDIIKARSAEIIQDKKDAIREWNEKKNVQAVGDLTKKEDAAPFETGTDVIGETGGVTSETNVNENVDGVNTDVENNEGDIENEREIDRGNDGQTILDDTEGQVGSVEESGSQRGIDRVRAAIEIKNQVDAVQDELISTKELGDTNGTENKTAKIVPESVYTQEMRDAAQKAQKQGYEVTYTVGQMQSYSESRETQVVDGFISGKKIVVKADSVTISPEQFIDHELFHGAVAADPTLVMRAADRINNTYAPDEVDAVLEWYIKNFRGVYDAESGYEIEQKMMTEMLADAYAGISRKKSANAARYTEDVKKEVGEITGSNVNESTQYSVKRTSKMPYIDQINAYYNGDVADLGRNDDIYVMDKQSGLAELGLGEKPFFLKKRNLNKSIRDSGNNEHYSAHNISRSIVEKLPELLRDPVLVVVGENRIAVIVDEKVDTKREKNAPLLIGINPDSSVDGKSAYEIMSIYGRENFQRYLELRAEDSKILVGNQKKAEALLRDVGKSYSQPVAYAADLSPEILSQREDVVKETDGITWAGSETSYSAKSSETSKREKQDRILEIIAQQSGYQEDVPGDGLLKLPDDMTEEEKSELQKKWEERKLSQEDIAARENAASIVQQITKESFVGSEAMEKLNIRIDGSVVDYAQTQQLIERDKAARSVERETKKAIERLAPSSDEDYTARGIALGVYYPGQIPRYMDQEKILELADYYMAEETFKRDLVSQRRADIAEAHRMIAAKVFGDNSEKSGLPKILSGLTKTVMNERTPERVAKMLFGTTKGEEIWETYFRPVWRNGAEMYRFQNWALEQVEKFRDSNGKNRKLTKKEREIAQKVKEAREGKTLLDSMKKSAKDRILAAAQDILGDEDNQTTDEEKKVPLTKSEAMEKHGITDEHERDVLNAYLNYLTAEEELNNKKVDKTIVENAIKKYAELYDQFYDAINEFLINHGYQPIGYIKGYAPHMQPEENQRTLLRVLKSLGVNTEAVTSLPASIAGKTADFKPNMRYNPYFQQRTSDLTEYDIAKGFESYIRFMGDVIYHTDDVMRVRQAANYFRERYSSEDIGSMLEQARNLRNAPGYLKKEFLVKYDLIKPGTQMSVRDMDKKLEKVIEEKYADVKSLTKYSEFVTWLDNYANILAGKQSLADRGMEFIGSRGFLNTGSKLMRAFSTSNIGGNISSALNQTAQLPLIQARVGVIHLTSAFNDIVSGKVRKESFVERSDFLTDKAGVDRITSDNYEKFLNMIFKPAEMMDRLLSTMAVRGEYNRLIKKGETPENALRKADDFGRQIMGSRMRGVKPQGFESKSVGQQLIHVFQVEAVNTLDYLVTDIPQVIRETAQERGKLKAAGYAAAIAINALLNAFALNRIAEELWGGTPAPYDLIGLVMGYLASGWGEDDNEYLQILIDNAWERLFGERLFDTEPIGENREFNRARAAEDSWYQISNDIPYVSNVAGVIGWGDQTLPTVGFNEALEGVKSGAKTLWDQWSGGEEETGLDWAGAGWKAAENILIDAGTEFLPLGRQISKTYSGLKAMLQGGKYSGWGENRRLQYPVDVNAWNAAKAAAFGVNATEESRGFYTSDDSALSASQTERYDKLVSDGVDKFAAYEAVQWFREINGQTDWSSLEKRTAKRDAINDLDATDEDKYQIYRSLDLNSEETDPETYDQLAKSMLDGGMDWNQITDTLNAYDKINNGMELKGAEKSNAILDLVNLVDLDDERKKQITKIIGKLSEKREENITEMQETGLTWNEVTQAWKQYNLLYEDPEDAEEKMTANQKATELARWLDEQGWSRNQKDATKDTFVFYNMNPAEAKGYEKLTGAGLDSEAADTVTKLLGELEPEEGKKQVSDEQKMEAIVGAGLSYQDEVDAIGTLLSDNQKQHFDQLMEQGMSPEEYAQYRRATKGLEADKDENGKSISGSKKKKVLAAIDGLPVPDSIKDLLYFAEGYGEKDLDDAPWNRGGIDWAGR